MLLVGGTWVLSTPQTQRAPAPPRPSGGKPAAALAQTFTSTSVAGLCLGQL